MLHEIRGYDQVHVTTIIMGRKAQNLWEAINIADKLNHMIVGGHFEDLGHDSEMPRDTFHMYWKWSLFIYCLSEFIGVM